MSNMKKLRKEGRLKADRLPGPLRSFTVLLAGEIEKTARTVDASPGGFGLVMEGNPDLFIVGTTITLYPLGRDSPLHGKIIHVAETFEGYRVGVSMLETARYETWRKQICELMAAQPPGTPDLDPDRISLGED